jgi:hypothetical protein
MGRGGKALLGHLSVANVGKHLTRWRTCNAPGHPPLPSPLVIPQTVNPSFNKMLYCDCADGLVRIATVDKVTCLQAVPADREPGGDWRNVRVQQPRSPPMPAVDRCSLGLWLTPHDLPCCMPRPAGARDGVLRWFEAFAEALSAGRFAVEALEGDYPESVGISLFPQLPPWRSEAVTEVRRAHLSLVARRLHGCCYTWVRRLESALACRPPRRACGCGPAPCLCPS